jgi:hypothetical protein
MFNIRSAEKYNYHIIKTTLKIFNNGIVLDILYKYMLN